MRCEGGAIHLFILKFLKAAVYRELELVFVDLGNEIRVIERLNGNDSDTELWHKMDFSQFSWAVRGKCQKFFSK